MIKLFGNLRTDNNKKFKERGDPVIQIGTVFYTYGKEDSYERYIQVIGPEHYNNDDFILNDYIPCNSEDDYEDQYIIKLSGELREKYPKETEEQIDKRVEKVIEYKKSICCDLKDVYVKIYKTEKDLLEGWTELIQKKNPDYLTGLNLWIQFDYIIGRVR